MILRYNSLSKTPREVKVNLKKIQVTSWRFTYTPRREITHLYFNYIDAFDQKNSLYVPVAQILDKAATFEYIESNFKDKCLEK